MPKKPVSLTLDEANLLWLKGRARVTAGGSVSEAVDQIVAEARAGRLGVAQPVRSVVGTIDLGDDALLETADAAVRGLFAVSLAGTIPAFGTSTKSGRSGRSGPAAPKRKGARRG